MYLVAKPQKFNNIIFYTKTEYYRMFYQASRFSPQPFIIRETMLKNLKINANQ